MEDCRSHLDVIEDLVKQLKNKNLSNVAITRILQQLQFQVGNMDVQTSDNNDANVSRNDYDYRVENVAILLWNLTVVRKSSDLPVGLDNRMKRIACDIVGRVRNLDTKADTYHKRRLQMYLKTVQSLISCGEAKTAYVLVLQALESAKWLRDYVSRQYDRGEISAGEKEKTLFGNDEDAMKINIYRSEALFALGRFEEANEQLESAEKLCGKHLRVTCILSVLCYNLGVACYHKRQYKQAITFLKRAVKNGPELDVNQQGRTLRLMANCYLDWNRKTFRLQALEATDVANRVIVHSSGLYLRLRIMLLEADVDDKLLSIAIDDLLENVDVSADMAYKALELLMQQEKSALALKVIRLFLDLYPESCYSVRVYSHQVAILVGWREYEQAEKVIFEFIKVAEKKNLRKDLDALAKMWISAADVANVFLENEDYRSALRWCDYCGSLNSRDPDRAIHGEARDRESQLHRNRALCFLNTGHTEKAWQALNFALEIDRSCVPTHYVRLKIAIARSDKQSVTDALLELMALSDGTGRFADTEMKALINLVTQLGLNDKKNDVKLWNKDLIVEVLKELCKTVNFPQCLTMSHYLTKVYQQTVDKYDESNWRVPALETVQAAYSQLKSYHDAPNDSTTKCLDSDEVGEHLDYFIKAVWNFALQCGEQIYELYSFYWLCGKLIELRSVVCEEWLVKRQTCSFMAAAAALDLAKLMGRVEQKRSWLEKAMTNVTQCYDIMRQLKGSPDQIVAELLLLLEFETKALLRDRGMKRTFVTATNMSIINPRTLEKMAVICKDAKCEDKSFYTRILTAAAERYLRHDHPDYVQISKMYIFIIDGSLEGNLQGIKARDTAWKLYSQLLELLPKSENSVPEIDIVRFMTRAWNVGIQMMSVRDIEEAERWCSLGLKFVQCLRELKSKHEPKMNEMYSDLLRTFRETRDLEE